MTIFVYIYQHDPLGGAELRLSLRSLQANFHPEDGQVDVMIVGDKPDWLKPDWHVRANSPYDHKLMNITHKVLIGCAETSGEEQIVCMEDDYIVLDHVESSPLVYWGPLTEHRNRVEKFHGPDHWYTRGFYATQVYLGGWVEPLSWELHRPFPIDPAAALDAVGPMDRRQFPGLWRSVYAAEMGLTGWQGIDGRYSGVQRGEPGIPFASLDDVIPKHLAKRFDIPSRWEA